MIQIASLDDPRIADYRSLADPDSIRRANLIVIEGRANVQRLLALPHHRVRSVLVTPVAYQALGGSGEFFVVDQALINAIAGYNIHRGCVALAVRPTPRTLADLNLQSARRLLILEGVNNPDNIGGLFRSAAAFGVDAVVLGPGCSDPYYRKAIRTSMSATLALPFGFASTWPADLATLSAHGFRVIALTPDANAAALETVPRALAKVAVMVGAEGAGLSDEALSLSDQRVRIAMVAGVDSLNVTVAASIALSHLFVA
ncbi:MAG TPA: RNA methyltransferase [Vicinamibacterales bacterium]|nr:RNA methyltransferase [Vicinamibacterales bacterium]